MPALPTVSQIAGQTIAHLRAEWDAKRALLEARHARLSITHDAYARQKAVLDKRYGEAIERERGLLWAIEHDERAPGGGGRLQDMVCPYCDEGVEKCRCGR